MAKAQSPGGFLEIAGIENEADAYRYMEGLRWPDGPVCPHCGNDEKHWFLTPKSADGETRKTRTGSLSARRVWRCAECKRQFSVLTGTVFHGSKVPLKTWLMVTFEMCANKNGIAAAEIQRKYKVGNKTAWFMAHRLREGMKAGAPETMRGTIGADETFIGRSASRMNKKTRERLEQRRNAPGGLKTGEAKTPVLSLINAETGEVRSAVVADVDGSNLRKVMSEQIDMGGSTLWTDEGSWYEQLGAEFIAHNTVNHSADDYVSTLTGASTNQAESFFSAEAEHKGHAPPHQSRAPASPPCGVRLPLLHLQENG
jgi:transposase-like protein